MTIAALIVVAGLVLVTMALAGTVLQRLPLSASLLYLLVGIGIGPVGLGMLEVDAIESALTVERLAEAVVIVSLFTAGLKLRVEWRDPRWHLPLRLAIASMLMTIMVIALVGMVGLGFSLGAAVLLGAMLAPTDPVLASDVQVTDARDQDDLRFALTGEAGLNDGTAFPFVMLGLGLLQHHELGPFGWRWVAIDIVWAVTGSIAIGAILGTAVGHLVLYLRRQHQSAVGLDDLLTLGLIALAYGAALLLHTYGFLAVFAAGLALRWLEQRATGPELDQALSALDEGGDEEAVATDPETAPVYMAEALLGFNESLERIGEVAAVVVVGAILFTVDLPTSALWFVPLLLLAIRPLSVWVGLAGAPVSRSQRHLISWFGIRGIGSLYYLMFALGHGLEGDDVEILTGLVLSCIAVSVVVHGISVTPLMARYRREIGDDVSPG